MRHVKITEQDRIDSDNHAAIMWWNSLPTSQNETLRDQYFNKKMSLTKDRVRHIWEKETQSRSKYALKIANSRGKKPVLADIKKAMQIIRTIYAEINPCEAKSALNECDKLLWYIIRDNE